MFNIPRLGTNSMKNKLSLKIYKIYENLQNKQKQHEDIGLHCSTVISKEAI